MLTKVRKRNQKIGQPPGTATYTGHHGLVEPSITILKYTENSFQQATCSKYEQCASLMEAPGNTWINIVGLQDVALIEAIANTFHLHPLTVEDILNVDQRPKVEEFADYKFISLKMLDWEEKKNKFTITPLSIILGKNFVLSFQEVKNDMFTDIYQRFASGPEQRLRQQGCDYLVYRLIDTVIDYYFVVLEGLGNLLETVEEAIINVPQAKNTRPIYRLKKQVILLRKTVWPMREIVSHLLQSDEALISSFTRIYIRDLYDHVVQAIDMIESFRDMLSSMLDMYLSSLTNRMNEIMKTLTIIATIFIPITFVASVYGMNFINMPELHWHYGYYMVLGLMGVVAIIMLIYFHKKDWI